MFGKPVTPKPGTQHHSMSVDWNDSDSSVDSVCSSASSSSGDPDWPSHTGFEVHVHVVVTTCNLSKLLCPPTQPLTQNRTRTVPHPSSPTLPSLSLSLPPSITHSASFSTTREVQYSIQRMPTHRLSVLFSSPVFLSSHRSAVPCGLPHFPQICCPVGDTGEPVSAAGHQWSPCL